MLLKSQQQMTSRLEVTQNQSESRFSKIEAELSNVITAADKMV